MKYFSILGNNPALSAAEISTAMKVESKMRVAAGNVLLWDGPATNAKKLIARLGGTIKIGSIFTETNRHDNKKIKEEILKLIEKNLTEKHAEGKYCFGFSYYGQSNFPIFPLGLEIKKILKEKKISCRLVTSREKTLSSVVVEQNKLLSRGMEIILAEDKEVLYIGETDAVQPFKELSHRDFGRPNRDDRSGMLPPKLAQIMLNLSGKIPNHCFCALGDAPEQCPTILDPFCGSGTILTEAFLMGVKNLIGSDVSEKAIDDTKNNFAWIKEKFPNLQSQAPNLKLFKISSAEISKNIPQNSVDAVVTEPYLGPQRGKIDFDKTKAELEKIYSQALAEFFKILKTNGTIVMIWPVFTGRGTHAWDFLNPDILGFKIQNPLLAELRGSLRSTERGTLIYGRPGQKVFREIVVLKKAPQ
jgi:tRNA G10  N-methylase Trm11